MHEHGYAPSCTNAEVDAVVLAVRMLPAADIRTHPHVSRRVFGYGEPPT
jgi:hypothetical protein